MIIETVVESPAPGLGRALEEFEQGFLYPLGAGRHFRISHGQDYARFFRAIDAASGASFVAVGKDGRVRGTLGAVVRPLRFPTGETRLAAYLGDLKTAPGVGRGWAFLRLGAEVNAWCRGHGAVVAYGIVMDGTPQEPTDYTGKLGIYPFRPVHHLAVLRLPVNGPGAADPALAGESAQAEECFHRLTTTAFTPLGGASELRSSIHPIALVSPEGEACGVLEDTRLAKQLFDEDGQEMRAMHLSRFAYADPAAGVKLLLQAVSLCAARRLAPALFVALPEADRAAFVALLDAGPDLVQAGATIYGTWPDLCGEDWNINTADI